MKFPLILKKAFLLLILLDFISANAQKRQKDIQDNSLFVSVPVKIDAKLNEWQDTLQAFNRNALVGYTIANDKKNLYLVIKSSDAINSAKILAGGITIALNTEGRKNNKDAFAITFPVNTVARSGGQRSSAIQGGQRQMGRGGQFPRRTSETDSVILERRKAQIAQFKEIKIHGFKAIPDSVISIYNEYGIKVAMGYDAKGSLIYELAIPLNLLDMVTDGKKEVAYNVKLNGRSFAVREPGATNQIGGIDSRERRSVAGYGGNQGGGNTIVSSFGEPADFWGKYTLATQ